MTESIAQRPPAAGRVLYLINDLTVGGAEIGLANLLRRGFFEGFEFRIATIWPPSPMLLDAYPVLKPLSGDVLLADGARGGSAYLRALVGLVRLVRRWRPQVLVCSLAQSVLLGRAVRLMFPRLRLITFEHNAKLRSQAATRMFQATAGLSDGVWADSPATLASVTPRHRYRPGAPTAVVRLQEIADCLEAGPPLFDDGEMRLLFVGRLSEQKNVENCIRAVRIALDAGVPLSLDIIGDGDLKPGLVEVSESLGLQDRVVFHGFQIDWTRRLAGQGRIGVLASTREGFAITALQMLALGMPLVTTAAGEIGSYLEDGRNGFVVAGPSAEAVAAGYAAAWAARDAWPAFADRAQAAAQAFQTRMEVEFSDDAARAMMRGFTR